MKDALECVFPARWQQLETAPALQWWFGPVLIVGWFVFIAVLGIVFHRVENGYWIWQGYSTRLTKHWEKGMKRK